MRTTLVATLALAPMPAKDNEPARRLDEAAVESLRSLRRTARP